jgi:nitrogenase-stabilizing/protective protein
MEGLTQRLKALSSANEFLEFFGIAYDERVVHVNRLHILKRFYQYLHQAEGLSKQSAEGPDEQNEIEMFRRYRELLARAYGDFVTSTAAKEKVFKVFQDADGQQHVSVDRLKESLADRRRPSPPAGVMHAA